MKPWICYKQIFLWDLSPIIVYPCHFAILSKSWKRCPCYACGYIWTVANFQTCWVVRGGLMETGNVCEWGKGFSICRVFFNCSFCFSVPTWKIIYCKPEHFFQEKAPCSSWYWKWGGIVKKCLLSFLYVLCYRNSFMSFLDWMPMVRKLWERQMEFANMQELSLSIWPNDEKKHSNAVVFEIHEK